MYMFLVEDYLTDASMPNMSLENQKILCQRFSTLLQCLNTHNYMSKESYNLAKDSVDRIFYEDLYRKKHAFFLEAGLETDRGIWRILHLSVSVTRIRSFRTELMKLPEQYQGLSSFSRLLITLEKWEMLGNALRNFAFTIRKVITPSKRLSKQLLEDDTKTSMILKENHLMPEKSSQKCAKTVTSKSSSSQKQAVSKRSSKKSVMDARFIGSSKQDSAELSRDTHSSHVAYTCPCCLEKYHITEAGYMEPHSWRIPGTDQYSYYCCGANRYYPLERSLTGAFDILNQLQGKKKILQRQIQQKKFSSRILREQLKQVDQDIKKYRLSILRWFPVTYDVEKYPARYKEKKDHLLQYHAIVREV